MAWEAWESCGCGQRFAKGFMRCPRCGTLAPAFADRVIPAPQGAVVRLQDGMPFKDLRAMCKAAGLSGAGSAAELAARLAEHEAKAGG
jgi:hypothetical protein